MKPREARRRVMVAARMRTQDGWSDVLIRNVSSRGMLIETGTVAPRDKYVEVRSGSHAMVGRVCWRNASQFGIQTQDRVDIDGLAQRPSTPAKRGTPRPPQEDRRQEPRLSAADLARAAERSRLLGRATQSLFLGACVVIAAVTMASQVYETLAKPMRTVTATLAR